MALSKSETPEALRSAEIDFDPDRYNYIVDEIDVHHRRAAALILAENGFSHTGIAKILDVNGGTGKNYLQDLQDEFGKDVIQSKPKPERYEELHPEDS